MSEWYDGMRKSLGAVQAHPGHQAYLRWHGLRRSYTIFQRNSDELTAVLVGLETDPTVMFQRWTPAQSDLIDQRLHNMLSSAISLVDHTRRVLKSYAAGDFRAEFDSRNEAIMNAPVAQFVRSFRNFMLHHRVPPYSRRISMQSIREGKPGSVEVRIEMPAEVLLAMGKGWWSAPAKAYIRSCGETVHLTGAVREYIEKMRGLYKWAFDQYETLHADELAEAKQLSDEHNARWNAGPPRG